MKIWGEIPKVSGSYDKRKSVQKTDAPTNVSGKKDVVSISNRAKDFQTVMKALKEIPDKRNEKIDELSEKYSAGSSDVKGTDIVSKMLKSIGDRKN